MARIGRAQRRWAALAAALLACALGAASCGHSTDRVAGGAAGPASAVAPSPRSAGPVTSPSPQHAVLPAPTIVPQPESLAVGDQVFTLGPSTRILTPAGSAGSAEAAEAAEAAGVGTFLADLLRRSTGYRLPVVAGSGTGGGSGDIVLELAGADDHADQLGAEGYRLTVTTQSVTVRAQRPAGLFHGVQTLRQLLPARVETGHALPGPWTVPGVRVVDRPRYAWRGASLDVARHFFTVAEVERYVDLLALYKLNTLHLHLADDQGWRIAVDGWPRLTSVGGATAVGGGPGGFYTAADYRRIVAYARARYVTVVPEIDMPGHVNAALVAYPELSCDGRPRAPFTRIGGPPESLCVGKPVVTQFLNAVIGQLAALTPGEYLHVGGDEVQNLDPASYANFTGQVQQIARGHGKTPVGWQEIATGKLASGTVVQYWDPKQPSAAVRTAAARGTRFVLSPASHAYLDMKYDSSTELGLSWAGFVSVRDAYSWDPATVVPGIGAGSVLGVEAALWSETLRALADVEFMVLPRLPAVAEVGWSPQSSRDWDGFSRRLAAQGPRWTAMSVNFFRSPQVPWVK